MLQLGKKIAAVGFLVFIGLWIVGVLRAFTLEYPPPPPATLVAISGDRDYLARANSNFSANNLKTIGLAQTPLPMMLDHPAIDKIRITDKTAFLTASTIAFREDEAMVRAAIAEFKGETFAEKKSGIEPARTWTIEIGVHPDKFDELVEKLRTIGSLSTITVEQKDRTSEFRRLHAQRQSLKKYLESITKLREAKAPSLEEALKLEQKIQDIQRELDGLSVQFGELLGNESYYHVHVTLIEHQPGDRRDRSYSMTRRIGDGFVWAIAWWFGVVLLLSLLTGCWLSVRVLFQR